jgi:hypothetical protein
MTASKLTFHWKKRGDRYIFKCETALSGDPNQCNEQLNEILRWCKAQKLKTDEYRFEATRRSITEKTEVFGVNGREGGFSGGTVFHPAKLTVELELPDRLGPMFTMAFTATDERVE